jgi:hypothetical protein
MENLTVMNHSGFDLQLIMAAGGDEKTLSIHAKYTMEYPCKKSLISHKNCQK